MKRVLLSMTLLISPILALSQTVYYDALILKKYAKDNGGILKIDPDNYEIKKEIDLKKKLGTSLDVSAKKETIEELKKIRNRKLDTLFSVLKTYFPIDDNYSAGKIDSILHTNPFFQSFSVSGFTRGNEKVGEVFRSISASTGGLNVTSIADGLAQFLIERANEEINVWFFRKFKEDLSKSIELQTLFPATFSFLRITEPYQYAQTLQLLREAFKKDLNEIIDHMEDLASLGKYQEMIRANQALKGVVVGLAGASIVSKLKNGTHPADVIDSLGQKKYLKGAGDNLYSGITLLSLLSQSLRDTTEDRAYVPAALFDKNILQDKVAFTIYLGLLYQETDSIYFFRTKRENNIVVKDSISIQSILKTHSTEIIGGHSFGLQLLTKFNKLEKDFNKLKSRSDTSELKYIYYYDFYNSTIDLVELGLNADTYFSGKWTSIPEGKRTEIKKFIYVARKGNDIYKNVSEKNYSLAVLNFTVIYDTLFSRYKSQIEHFNNSISENLGSGTEIEKTKKLLSARIPDANISVSGKDIIINSKAISSRDALIKYYGTRKLKKAIEIYIDSLSIGRITNTKFIKYAGFMSAVAQAQSPDDVKAALTAAALPAGSSSIKRQTPFNISINSYLGFHYGNEYLEGNAANEAPGWSSIYGISAPIGLAFSWGLGKQLKGGSFSVFTSILDIGAVASFRLKDDAAEQLPQIKLENILAPGAYLVYGIPKTPLSVGYGWQKGPQLRQVNVPDPANQGQFKNDLLNGYRWSIFLAVDIPLFNLYTKPK